MKPLSFIVLFLVMVVLFSPGCAGRFYADVGIGYIQEATVSQITTVSTPIGDTTIESEFNLPISNSFLLLRGGYKMRNIHIEYEQIRNEQRYFQTARIYHRFHF